MTSEVAAETASSRGRFGSARFEPHNCFACGELNEGGLHLALHADAEGCWTEVTLDQRFEGWDGVAHGGIACTILDEVMAWSVVGRGTWGVTARLNAAFRRPIRIGRRLRAMGHVSAERRRTFQTAAQIVDVETGELLASAEGVFVAVPADQLATLQARYRLRPATAETPATAGARA